MAEEATIQSAALSAPIDSALTSSELADPESKAETTTNGVGAHITEPTEEVATEPSAPADLAAEGMLDVLSLIYAF
jgi:hypothetical protein